MARFAVDSPSPPPKPSGDGNKSEKKPSGPVIPFQLDSPPAAKKPRRFWFRQPPKDDLNSPSKSGVAKKPQRRWWLFKRSSTNRKLSMDTAKATDHRSIVKVEEIKDRYFDPTLITRGNMRKLSAEKIPASEKKTRKSLTRSGIEIISLLIVGASLLGYYGGKDKLFQSGTCGTSSIRTEDLQLELKIKLFRQETVIQNLTTIFKGHSGVTMLAFVGGMGTGKSFTAKLLTNYFGLDNSHAYNWDDQSHNMKHTTAVQELILDLPSCMNSLLIVDNMAWQNRYFMEDLNRWLQIDQRVRDKSLVIIFIFEMDKSGLEMNNDLMEAPSLGGFKAINYIKFKSFLEADGREYLAHLKAKGDNVKLNSVDLDFIVQGANVEQYGLKKLANKFLT